MAIPAYAELVYTIASEADEHLNDIAKTGKRITPNDIEACVTAWVKQFVPDDAEKQKSLIRDIIASQFYEWTPAD